MAFSNVGPSWGLVDLCYGMRQPFSSVYSDSCSYDQSSCSLVAIATGNRRTRPRFILELRLCRLCLSVISLGRIRDPGTAHSPPKFGRTRRESGRVGARKRAENCGGAKQRRVARWSGDHVHGQKLRVWLNGVRWPAALPRQA